MSVFALPVLGDSGVRMSGPEIVAQNNARRVFNANLKKGVAVGASSGAFDLAEAILTPIIDAQLTKAGISESGALERIRGESARASNPNFLSEVFSSGADVVTDLLTRARSAPPLFAKTEAELQSKLHDAQTPYTAWELQHRPNQFEFDERGEIRRKETGRRVVGVSPEIRERLLERHIAERIKQVDPADLFRPLSDEEAQRILDEQNNVPQSSPEVAPATSNRSSSSTATPTQSDTRKSSANPCDCPSQIDRAGRTCGNRSAFVRRGGRMPSCGGDAVYFADRSGSPGIRKAVRTINRVIRRPLTNARDSEKAVRSGSSSFWRRYHSNAIFRRMMGQL